MLKYSENIVFWASLIQNFRNKVKDFYYLEEGMLESCHNYNIKNWEINIAKIVSFLGHSILFITFQRSVPLSYGIKHVTISNSSLRLNFFELYSPNYSTFLFLVIAMCACSSGWAILNRFFQEYKSLVFLSVSILNARKYTAQLTSNC
jgi:hypothetical protein